MSLEEIAKQNPESAWEGRGWGRAIASACGHTGRLFEIVIRSTSFDGHFIVSPVACFVIQGHLCFGAHQEWSTSAHQKRAGLNVGFPGRLDMVSSRHHHPRRRRVACLILRQLPRELRLEARKCRPGWSPLERGRNVRHGGSVLVSKLW